MAARHGPVAMAAHQICMQVWLAVSLLTDALATSGQVLNHPLYKTCSLLTFSVILIPPGFLNFFQPMIVLGCLATKLSQQKAEYMIGTRVSWDT